jgi:Flp pilus assembly pilin Flp
MISPPRIMKRCVSHPFSQYSAQPRRYGENDQHGRSMGKNSPLINRRWMHKVSIVRRVLYAGWQEDDGQDMVEYALLLGFVALAGVSLLSGIRTSISSIWTQISTGLATGSS